MKRALLHSFLALALLAQALPMSRMVCQMPCAMSEMQMRAALEYDQELAAGSEASLRQVPCVRAEFSAGLEQALSAKSFEVSAPAAELAYLAAQPFLQAAPAFGSLPSRAPPAPLSFLTFEQARALAPPSLA